MQPSHLDRHACHFTLCQAKAPVSMFCGAGLANDVDTDLRPARQHRTRGHAGRGPRGCCRDGREACEPRGGCGALERPRQGLLSLRVNATDTEFCYDDGGDRAAGIRRPERSAVELLVAIGLAAAAWCVAWAPAQAFASWLGWCLLLFVDSRRQTMAYVGMIAEIVSINGHSNEPSSAYVARPWERVHFPELC
jgi:hypothetical protein